MNTSVHFMWYLAGAKEFSRFSERKLYFGDGEGNGEAYGDGIGGGHGGGVGLGGIYITYGDRRGNGGPAYSDTYGEGYGHGDGY
jgi:hypothetical protein